MKIFSLLYSGTSRTCIKRLFYLLASFLTSFQKLYFRLHIFLINIRLALALINIYTCTKIFLVLFSVLVR